MSQIVAKFRISKILAALVVACAVFSSCQSMGLQESQGNLRIDDIDFSDDYKTIKVVATAVGDYGEHIAIDSAGTGVTAKQVKIALANGKNENLEVKQVRNLTAERFDSLGLKVIILVDLTLNQDQIDAERLAVAQIRHSFNPDNLFVSFLKSGGVVTPTEPLTDFVVENNFVEDDGIGDKYLYKGILDKILELDENRQPSADAGKKALVVMSDGNVWGEDGPIDPEHFRRQDKIEEYASKIDVEGCFFYADFSAPDPADILGEPQSNKTLLALCSRHGGLYQDQFDWDECCHALETHYNLSREDFEIILAVPDGYYYEGVPRKLHITLPDEVNPDESLVGTYDFTVGNIFFPTIVNGLTEEVIAMRGLFLLLAILLFAFIVLQFIVPAIKYRHFLRRDVALYTGPNMCINGRVVADTCYLCKAPFKEGDKIVAKCEHTMHKDCWDENGYHCPEYGSRCKDGSHYYNKHRLLDSGNAPYYAKWVLLAVIASVISWICFYFLSDSVVTDFASKYITKTYHFQPGSPEYERMFAAFDSYSSYLSLFSACIAIPLVGLLSFLTIRSNVWWKKLLNFLIRTIIAAAIGIILFQLNSLFALTVRDSVAVYVFEFVTWLVFTFCVAFCLTVKTSASVYPRKFFMFLLGAVVLSFLGSFLIMYFMFDYRLLLSLYFLLYCCCIAIAVAFVAPKSYRYVLHTEGCIKTTDIALYKWFRANPNANVTIGKSVDCSIQMTWDIQGDVAPRNAEIYMKKDKFYLRAIEEGVKVGRRRNLKEGESVRLYHRTYFQIGTTKFTYQETDMERGKK